MPLKHRREALGESEDEVSEWTAEHALVFRFCRVHFMHGVPRDAKEFVNGIGIDEALP